jgi:hypothetical protein
MSIKVVPYQAVIDERPLSELNFGYNEISPEDREREAAWVREELVAMGVQTAQGIVDLGCTGAANHLTSEEIPRLRLGLAGCGVGLPCYVPIGRFCLAHNTIGGLEPGQLPLHVENIARISRDLTPAEAAKVAVMEKSRRIEKDNLADTQKAVSRVLGGRDLDAVKEALTNSPDQVLDLDEDPQTDLHNMALTPPRSPWRCTEHRDLNWSCRHCVAQAIVEGPLIPVLAGKIMGELFETSFEEIPRYLDRAEPFEVFVRAASFKVGLVRE